MRVAPLVVCLAAPAVVLSLVAPVASGRDAASEQRTVVKARDAGHDVRYIDDGFARSHVRRAPGRSAGDITSLQVRQRGAAVLARLRMRRLPPPARGNLLFSPTYQMFTPSGAYTAVVVAVRPLPRSFVFLLSRSGFVECAGLKHRLSYRQDLVALTIPRSCLGNPAWVRTRAATVNPFAQSVERFYVDVAPGRSLRGVHTTRRAYAPPGGTTRVARPRIVAVPVGLDPRIRDALDRIGFLPRRGLSSP